MCIVGYAKYLDTYKGDGFLEQGKQKAKLGLGWLQLLSGVFSGV